MAILPANKTERRLFIAVAVVVLIGLVAAFLCFLRAAKPEKASSHDAPPMVQATPEPKPLSGWTILVDPGHGGYDGGARARDSGTWEKHINLAVALEVEKALAERGASVIMTRREDADLCTDSRPANKTMKREDMENRVGMAEQFSADMVLSIHMNEYRNRSQSGPQVFYRAGCDSGRLLAGCMQDSLIRTLEPKKERSALSGDYFILRLDVPSVLIECGFISNPAEEKLLLSPSYQAKLAQAIADGAQEYIRLTTHP